MSITDWHTFNSLRDGVKLYSTSNRRLDKRLLRQALRLFIISFKILKNLGFFSFHTHTRTPQVHVITNVVLRQYTKLNVILITYFVIVNYTLTCAHKIWNTEYSAMCSLCYNTSLIPYLRASGTGAGLFWLVSHRVTWCKQNTAWKTQRTRSNHR